MNNMNSRCGMRNAECGKRRRDSAQNSICLSAFTIPHSAFRIGRSLGVALAVCCLATTTVAGTDVLCLGVGRGYDFTTSQGTPFELVMAGESMQTVRAALAADGFTFTAGESFTAADLAGFNIVFLGLFDPSERLGSDERVALDAFVRGGGALIYMGDNEVFRTPNASVVGIFGLTCSSDNSALSASRTVDPLHPIILGPAGRVNVYDGSLNLPGFFGGIDSLGPFAHAVLATENRTVVAAIEPGALQPGSGPVVYISESNGFLDSGLGTVELGDNITLMRNIFAFAAGIQIGCTTDASCADDLFCNGIEACVNDQCLPGTWPCGAGEGCDESSASCGPCADDAQCNDGLFCNGDEICIAGVCEPGSRPCASTEGCHESSDSCGPCTDDQQCDDGLFCNGLELCDIDGICSPEVQACPDPCEHCDEQLQACIGCLLDIDGDGFIGTGDFGFFAGCFGACYPPDDPCLEANFDGSEDGCVGTGDFAPFSGCFGGSCVDCRNCSGPGGGSAVAAVAVGSADVQLILLARSTATKVDTLSALPESTETFEVGETFYVELWANRASVFQDGVAAVYVDLVYDPAILRLTDIVPGDLFEAFNAGEIDPVAGEIRSLGGCTEPGADLVGVEPAWARVATLTAAFKTNGGVTLRTGPAGATFGISVFGSFGNLDSARIAFGRLELVLPYPIEERPPLEENTGVDPGL